MSPGAGAAAPPRIAPLPDEPIHVLHLGASPVDVDRTRHHLLGHGARFAVDGALTADECLARLVRERYDVLLVAERAADMGGLEVLRAVRARPGGVPVVLLLRERDDRVAGEALTLGAFDYLVERAGDLVKLPRVLENAAAQRRQADARRSMSAFSDLLGILGLGAERDDLLQRIVEAAVDLLQVDWALLLLLESGDTLVPRAGAGVRPGALAGLRFPAEGDGWQRLCSAPPPAPPEPIAVTVPWPVASMAAGLDAALGIPLVGNGRRLGALLVAAPPARRFRASEEQLFQTLAELTALAVEKQSLAHQLVHTQRLSTVGRMVAGIAHELNNPLAVILGSLDLLRQEPAAERLSDRLGRVATQTERAVKIVRTLLALARNRPTQRTAVPLDALLTETLELTAYDLKHGGVRVLWQLGDALPVVGDPDQLRQVFTNLVLNVCQAVAATGGPGTLTISADVVPPGDRVRVHLADSGPGIPPEHLPHVFEPFFTTKNEGEGTGLGLAICQWIVEGQGGQISVDSQPGHGARFTVELPAADARGDVEATSQLRPGAPLAGVSVLLVEDEPLVGDMMEDLLRLDGHVVDRAVNGREALDRLARGSYDLIISDVRMPDLSGPALHQELRQIDPALARRVIFVTGDVMSPETQTFLDQTGLVYLEKPFEVTAFQAAVRRVLEAA
jgi:signal transduction histidine kinase/DNA-binding response OmpR family regulator